MTRRRAFTLVEVVIASTMTVVLIGVTTLLYAFTVSRLGSCLSLYADQREAESAIDPIDQTMRLANSCSTLSVNGNACLKCTLPQTCTDTNGDGIYDSCTPRQITRRGYETYGTGMRVWFYMSDSTGLPGNAGANLTMALVPGSDSTPGAGSINPYFDYFPGQTVSRFELLTGFTVTTSSQPRSIKVKVTASSLTRNGTQTPTGANTTTELSDGLTRKAYSRNWRP